MATPAGVYELLAVFGPFALAGLSFVAFVGAISPALCHAVFAGAVAWTAWAHQARCRVPAPLTVAGVVGLGAAIVASLASTTDATTGIAIPVFVLAAGSLLGVLMLLGLLGESDGHDALEPRQATKAVATGALTSLGWFTLGALVTWAQAESPLLRRH